jgi:hypothetical protein
VTGQLCFDLDLDRLDARRLGRLEPAAPAVTRSSFEQGAAPGPVLRPVRVRRRRAGPKLWMLEAYANPGRARRARHRDGWRRVETVTLHAGGAL